MPPTLLKSIKLPAPKQNRENNIENGNDAEVYAASLIIKAIGAEVSWSSRNEDGRKIDLICSYDHPWIDKERIIFFTQVKSGKTYGKLEHNGFTLFSTAKKAAQRTSHSICIVWIDRNSHQAYWAYIHPFSKSSSQEYSNYHLITPATKFDIARCQAKGIPGKSEGAGIILKKLSGDIKANRVYALNHYRKLKNLYIVSPNLGKIEFTRIGWRHMFRKQRHSSNKEKSFATIPYLSQILTHKPSDIYITNYHQEKIKNFEYRTCEYVLTYDKVKIDSYGSLVTVRVHTRMLEEIRWPTNWQSNAMLSQMVERRVVLLNAYYK